MTDQTDFERAWKECQKELQTLREEINVMKFTAQMVVDDVNRFSKDALNLKIFDKRYAPKSLVNDLDGVKSELDNYMNREYRMFKELVGELITSIKYDKETMGIINKFVAKEVEERIKSLEYFCKLLIEKKLNEMIMDTEKE